MLPPVLLGEFTAADAKVVGVGVRQLARLRRAGLAVQTGDFWRLLHPDQKSAMALAAIGPPVGLCGVTAARHYGWLEADDRDRVHVLVPRDRCPGAWPATVVHRGDVDASDLVVVGGTQATSPARTALDVAGSLDLIESLPMLDRLMREQILEPGQLTEALTVRPRWPGCARAATAVELMDVRHASHPESVFRALVHQAGLPAPVPQFVVRFNGEFIGRADFAWPQFRLLAEIDGYAFHSEYGVFVKDRQRQRKSWLAGWTALHFAAAEVTVRPAEVVAEVRTALALARRR